MSSSSSSSSAAAGLSNAHLVFRVFLVAVLVVIPNMFFSIYNEQSATSLIANMNVAAIMNAVPTEPLQTTTTTTTTTTDADSSETSRRLQVCEQELEKQHQQQHGDITSSTTASTTATATATAATPSLSTTTRRTIDYETGRTIGLLTEKNITGGDHFSAAWWMSSERFLKVEELRGIKSAVGAVFRVVRKPIRLTIDWLDLSVEHLSKWWKMAGYDMEGNNSIAYSRIVGNLVDYTHNEYVDATPYMDIPNNPAKDTVAVIAFMPSKSRRHPEWGQHLTVSVLAATVSSLTRLGFGRVILVSENMKNAHYAESTFRLLQHGVASAQPKENCGNQEEGWESIIRDSVQPNNMVGDTEVAYAVKDVEIDNTNMPKAALLGISKAMKGEYANDTVLQDNWLGKGNGVDRWKYVYYTEQDLVLHTKPDALAQLGAAMDAGNVLAPHRWQNLPHESDIKDHAAPSYMIPSLGSFEKVTSMDGYAGDSCCDMGSYKLKDDAEECKSGFWWDCGFTYGAGAKATREEMLHSHRRLEGYEMVRLPKGTGLASLAGSPHGRRCKPKLNGVC